MLKVLRVVGLVSFLFVVGMYLLQPKISGIIQKSVYKKFVKQEISGTVINTYQDFKRKGAFVVEIDNQQDTLRMTSFYLKDTNEHNLFKVGDSIYKITGKGAITVFRKGVLVYHNKNVDPN